MAKLQRILDSIRVSIGTFFDIRDIITIITGGGGGVVGVLYQIPVWVIVLLFVILAYGFVRPLIRYRKWVKTKDERKDCLKIPSIFYYR